MVKQFKHHFFLLSTPKDEKVHAFPRAEETYFSTNFTKFVSGRLMGGRREAIETIATMY